MGRVWDEYKNDNKVFLVKKRETNSERERERANGLAFGRK